MNEAISYYLQSLQSQLFLVLLSSFTIIEYSFICYFFLLLSDKTAKKVIMFVWIGFIIFAILDLFLVNENQSFDSFAIGIESIIIILLCIYFLFLQIRGSNSLVIYSTFNFWVIITFLLYFSGTFFLYIFTEGMREDVEFQKLYFIINISFNILKNILLSVAMYMKTNSIQNVTTSLPELDDDIIFHKPS